MSTSKLITYNNALKILGERKLASLAEVRAIRTNLDDVWDSAVSECLENANWKFALRASSMDSSVVVDPPAFGFQYAFGKPADWKRTYLVSASANFNAPLLDYRMESGYFYANTDPLYLNYVSDDPVYGLDLTLWPQLFARYVEATLAEYICPTGTGSESKMARVEKTKKRARADARAVDAMADPVKFPPMSSWAATRRGGGGLSSTGRGE